MRLELSVVPEQHQREKLVMLDAQNFGQGLGVGKVLVQGRKS